MLQDKQQELNKDAMKIKKGPNGINQTEVFKVQYSKKIFIKVLSEKPKTLLSREKKSSYRKSCYLHFKLGALKEYDIRHMSTT